MIGRRLQRLGEVTQRVLTTAAVIGRTFSLSLLEALEPGRSPTSALDALEKPSGRIWLSPNPRDESRAIDSLTS